MTELELAYIAGFFDGEGSISIFQEKTGRYRLARIGVYVVNTDFRPIKMLKEKFGGHYREVQRPGKKKYAVWSVSCVKASEFLKAILPFLIIKKERACLAIEIQELHSRSTRSKSRNQLGQFTKLSEDIRQIIQIKTESIKEMNA